MSAVLENTTWFFKKEQMQKSTFLNALETGTCELGLVFSDTVLDEVKDDIFGKLLNNSKSSSDYT